MGLKLRQTPGQVAGSAGELPLTFLFSQSNLGPFRYVPRIGSQLLRNDRSSVFEMPLG